MGEMNWLIGGIVIGIIIGVCIALIIHFRTGVGAQSVVFERDSEGRIVGIHYVTPKAP